ncbi:MAG: hypothetical protein WC809_14605 [Sinimarinibacterium sp.]|jgi:hypothetical protein
MWALQTTLIRCTAFAAAALLPPPVLAHSFGRAYNLPVPFWLYAWGAAATLVASFLVVGYFASTASQRPGYRAVDVTDSRSFRRARTLKVPAVLKGLSLAGLLLCLVTGFAGTPSPYGNFNMTFFWIWFVLGLAYLSALIGDVYALINPWRVLADALAMPFKSYAAGRYRYPARLGYWPAVALYGAFIWIELFGGTGPYTLAVILSGYSFVNLVGVGLFGARDWFRYCEFFGLFLRLIATLAPVALEPDQAGQLRVRLRLPFTGVLEAPAENIGMLVFTLFMLSSTAFDGLRETAAWQRLFWLDLYQAGLQHWVGSNPLAAYPAMRQLFLYWQSFWLFASPFVYLAIYLAFVWLMQRCAGRGHPVRVLALRFAPTLLPIALVYNITHYYTLIQTQGVKIVSLASDPLGRGWNLFGTAHWLQRAIIPDLGTVWHVQVGLIVAGHVVSVYLAHQVALRTFNDRRRAVVSQLPMLALMVLFTTAGLWILSQPLVTPGSN